MGIGLTSGRGMLRGGVLGMGLGTDLRKGDLTPRPGGMGFEVEGKSIGAVLGRGDIPVGKPGGGLNTGLNPSFGSAKLIVCFYLT